MKPLIREWIEKAEGDFVVATTLLRPRRHPVYDSVCFHSQQAIEKYMKAVLLEAGIEFEFTHVLPKLLDQLITINPMWDAFRESAKLLSNYGVRFRYPGSSADREMARDAVAAAKFIRTPLRAHLGIVDGRKRVVAKRAAIRKKGGTRKGPRRG